MDYVFLALAEVADPFRMAMLFAGVVIGLVVGVVPGIGGVFGLTLLLPLSYALDPYSAFALLLGVSAVTTTSDTIPAVLMGIPGTVGAVTTVLDGHPMAKAGQGNRALGAAFASSVIGGLFGAGVLIACLPVLHPLLLLLHTADFFAVSCVGLVLVASVSTANRLKGFVALLIGLLASFVGLDPVTATERMTFDTLYLWDGFATGAVFLGLFAVPELIALLERGGLPNVPVKTSRSELLGGAGEALRHWRVIVRSSAIGAVIGAVPGVGVTVIDWIVYRLEEGRGRRAGEPRFGEGNIRGVIAPESANNAKEGGYLIPTLAMGVPGSATMAILLGAFMIHGLTPGPDMLGVNLPVTISFVFYIAIANILGAALCFAFVPQLSVIARISAPTLVSVLLAVVTLAAFQSRNDLGDFVVFVGAALLGNVMRLNGWPRLVLALGFVLGGVVERYFFLAWQAEGPAIMLRPSVIVTVVLSLLLISGFARTPKRQAPPPPPTTAQTTPRAGSSAADVVMSVFFLLCSVGVIASLRTAPFEARMFPVGVAGLCGVISLYSAVVCRPRRRGCRAGGAKLPDPVQSAHWSLRVFACVGMTIGLVYLVGPFTGVFVGVFLSGIVMDGRASVSVLRAGIATALIYVLFQYIAHTLWPTPLFYR